MIVNEIFKNYFVINLLSNDITIYFDLKNYHFFCVSFYILEGVKYE